MPRVSSGARDTLSAAAIVRAARAIIEQDGVAGLSMRRLSDDLGVALGATYHHVPDRQALLRLVAQDISEDLELPDRTAGGWIDQIQAAVLSYVDLLHRYPGMVGEVADDLMAMTPMTLRAFLLECLAAAGFSERDQEIVLAALYFYVSGATTFGGVPELATPAVVRSHFESGLRLLLDGAAQRLGPSGSTAAAG
jgi:AcrR family transcriptional regulator